MGRPRVYVRVEYDSGALRAQKTGGRETIGFSFDRSIRTFYTTRDGKRQRLGTLVIAALRAGA
jgi:hypothetical protein